MTFIPVAVKRLTASDLTFFYWHFQEHNAGNQKAINLNANVFIDELFPGLPHAAARTGGRVTIDLRLFGPNAAEEYRLQRKIIKWGSYKNWRLDGEFVQNPPGSPTRFNVLEPHDYALFAFDSADGVVPYQAKVILIAAYANNDLVLHREMAKLVGPTTRMCTVGHRDIAELVNNADVPVDHPIFEVLLSEEVAEAAHGNIEAHNTLAQRRPGRPISPEELYSALDMAQEVGRRGEQYVDGWLSTGEKGDIVDYTWVAINNAVAPYDFHIKLESGIEFVEVKSTTGPHTRSFQISFAELAHAAAAEFPYHIYRISGLSDESATLRISEPLNQFATKVKDALQSLPDRVRATSFTVDPALLRFGTKMTIEAPIEQELEESE